MITRVRRNLLLPLLLHLISAMGPTVAAAEVDTSSKETAQKALSDVVNELNALEQWFTEAGRRSTEIEQQIKTQDQAISRLLIQRQAAEKALAQVRRNITLLERQQAGLQQETQAQRNAIVAHLQAASRLGGDDFIKQLLNQDSSADAERLMRYHGYFSDQRIKAMNQFKANLAQLTDTQHKLDAQLQEQTQRNQSLTNQSRKLQTQRLERKQAIQALAKERVRKSDQQAALQADSERLRALINQLRIDSTTLDGKAFAAAKGKLPLPLTGKVRHKFGATRAGTNLRWRGIDLAGTIGTSVTAVFRGQVVFSDWLRGFGLITIVDHGGGYMTLYGHADTLFKNAGDWVEGGETLARAGNSGGGYEPGIYFEVRHEGTVKNPTTWLAK